MRCVRKISNRFQTDHGGNLVAAGFASACVNKTAHLLSLKIGGFFIRESNEAQGFSGGFSSETACEREEGSDPTAIVICARAAENRIVMRTYNNDLRTNTGNFRVDVMAGLSLQFISLPAGLQSSVRKKLL